MKLFKLLPVCVVSIAMGVTAAYAAEHVVPQKDKKFTSKKLTAAVGDTILFRNEDSFVHNLYSRKGAAKFDSGAMNPGDTYSLKLDAAGKVTIRCAIHPRMKFHVKVK